MGFSFPKWDNGKGGMKRLRVIREGKVYDITNFADRHPGGRDVLDKHDWQDVDSLMQNPEVHSHSKTAYSILDKYYIGTVESFKDQAVIPDEVFPLREENYYKNDIVDWNKPILSQVFRLGERYFEWTHEPVDRSLRLFHSDFVEFFSKAPWFLVPMIWIPVILYNLLGSFRSLSQSSERWPQHQALNTEFGAGSILVLYAVGIMFWTLLEYTIHRWMFHLRPPSNWPWMILFHFILHGQHHKSPMDSMRLVFPPVPASLFATAFYLASHSIFPEGMAKAVFSGIVSGYLSYDMTHYYIHHGRPYLSYFKRLKTYHALHHYEHQELGFGISSKFWDYPFRTVIPEEERKKSS